MPDSTNHCLHYYHLIQCWGTETRPIESLDGCGIGAGGNWLEKKEKGNNAHSSMTHNKFRVAMLHQIPLFTYGKPGPFPTVAKI